MTRQEAMRRVAQEAALLALGFTREEAEQLRRISRRLRRWHEKECGTDGGCIIRDESGRALWLSSHSNLSTPIRDYETGAIRRLKGIIGQRNGRPAIKGGRLNARPSGTVTYYIQGDPRGAALYILRPGDVPPGEDADAYYSRGICVY